MHAAAVAAIALVALTSTDLLPTPPTVMAFVARWPPRLPRRHRHRLAPRPPAQARRSQNPSAAPVAAPAEIWPETGLEPPAAGEPGGVEGGIRERCRRGPRRGARHAAGPAAAASRAIRVGGNIRPPTKIRTSRRSTPILPSRPASRGVVILEAEVSAEGKVIDARILRSIPMLYAAALDAVRQWEYTPTLLNGVPRPIVHDGDGELLPRYAG